MRSARTLPWPGLSLAAIGSVALWASGLAPMMALALFIVWVGSLMIGSERPDTSPPPPSPAEALRDSFGRMIENSGVPLLVLSGDRVNSANQAARDTLGPHVVGQDARVALRHPNAVELMNSGRSGEAVVTGLVRRRDIWRVSLYQSDLGFSVIELINKTAEADVSRAHTDFVANASHELRTPLASIIGYVETLRDDPGQLDGPTAGRFLDTILREGQRLQNLVSDLMSLSRIEAEKHDRPDTPIDLAALTRRAAREGAGNNREDRLHLDIEDAIVLPGDRQQLEQLVRNLVDNALKYGAADGQVDVSLTRGEPGFATLTVRDRGDGIPAEHLPMLTRRFYRTDPGRSRAVGGTGLGLAIVKHIVERHQGRMDIASQRGEGTTVTVRFAVQPPGTPPETPSDPPGDPSAVTQEGGL